MSEIERGEPERDAWLREALRHAPDADTAAPAALSDAILRQARAATATTPSPRPTRRASPWAAAWSWLARPPVAAGFASVMVATLVGLMWWDRPMDETLQRPPATTMPATTVPAPVPAPAAARGEAMAVAPPAPERESNAAVAQAPGAERQKRVKPEAAAQPRPEPRTEARTAAGALHKEVAPADAPLDTVVPAAPPKLSAAPAPLPVPTAQEAAPVSRDDANGGLAAAPRAAAKAAAPAPAVSSLQALRLRDSAPGRPPAWADALASVAEQPQRWRWQRSGGMQAMTPALREWLTRLDAQTAARWHEAAPATDGGESLRLFRDGELRLTLRLDATGVALLPAGAPGSHTALAPATLESLRQALDDATR